MLAENIRIVRSSGSRAIDKLTVEILWLLGKSHLLGPLSTLGASTIEFRVHDGLTQFTTSSSAATPEEAASKVTQLTFLLKLIAIQQKPRNPIVSELLSHVAVKANNKQVDAEMTIPCERAA